MIKPVLKTILNSGKYVSIHQRLASNTKSQIDFSRINRILCLQMNAIGDSIMTQPAWSALKISLPDSKIDLVCRPHIAPLYRQDRCIHNIYSFEPHTIFSWVFKKSAVLRRLISDNRYDLIIDFSAIPLTAAFCANQDICPTIGFSRRVSFWKGDIDLGNAYDWTVSYSEAEHLRESMLRLISPLAKSNNGSIFPKIFIDRKAKLKADEILCAIPLKKNGYIVVHPGAKWLPKRWPVVHCRELIKLIADHHRIPIVLLGSSDDEQYISHILKGLRFASVHPVTSENLPVSASIIKDSLLCVNNDSAAMHIAAAVGASSISIFGPVSPDRCCPPEEEGCYVLYDSAFCSPCTLYYSKDRCRRGINSCMYEITPLDVFHQIENLII